MPHTSLFLAFPRHISQANPFPNQKAVGINLSSQLFGCSVISLFVKLFLNMTCWNQHAHSTHIKTSASPSSICLQQCTRISRSPMCFVLLALVNNCLSILPLSHPLFISLHQSLLLRDGSYWRDKLHSGYLLTQVVLHNATCTSMANRPGYDTTALF